MFMALLDKKYLPSSSSSSSAVNQPSIKASTGKAAASNAGAAIGKEKYGYNQATKAAQQAAKMYETTPIRVSKPDPIRSGVKGGVIGAALEVATRYVVSEYKQGAERGGVVGGIINTVRLK